MAHIKPWPAPLWRWTKRWAPSSLFGRSLLIIVLPIAIMQIAVTWVFFDAHWQDVNAHLSEGLAGDIALIVRSYEADPRPANLSILQDQAQRTLDLSVTLQENRDLPGGRRPTLLVPVDRTLRKALSDRIDQPVWFDTARYPAYVDVRVRVPQGSLRFIAPKDRVFATHGHIFLLWLAVATILLTLVALAFIRNQVRAIERLAAAADAFGRGVDMSFRPHGAREVRQAAHAFIAMRRRIARNVEQRASLLAAVSHDLRTPLTRLKLELALAEPGARIEAMKRDLADMEQMIEEYLAFARGEEGEAPSTVLLPPLLSEIAVGGRQAGAEVTIEAPPELAVQARAGALKRALANLVMNAAVHGETVRICATTDAEGVIIRVDDDGPGIPEDRLEEAMTPFSRLDAARSGDDKGVGLGLAIARDVARGHGGDLVLSRSPQGGLRATLRLPFA